MGESERWVEWLRGGSPWKGPLLALLLEQPGHSYDLASRLTNRVGSAWKLDHNEMWTRIVVSGPEHAGALLDALGVCERRVFRLLREYGKPFPTETWAGLELELAREGVTMRLQADLNWIERARKKIMEWGDRHGAA